MSPYDRISALRGALAKIADRTGERLRTKAQLEAAVDAIGLIASEALVSDADTKSTGVSQ